MKDEEKISFLFELIKRYDNYIGATNTKCTIYLTYFATTIGWIILSYARTLPAAYNECVSAILILLSCAVLLSSGFFIRKTLLIIFPVTTSSATTDAGRSMIFYGDVSNRLSSSYAEELRQLKYDDALKDLSEQAHVLAKTTNAKFSQIKELANRATLFHMYPLFLLLAVQVISEVLKWSAAS